jgi:hypothetical protein
MKDKILAGFLGLDWREEYKKYIVDLAKIKDLSKRRDLKT